MKMQKVMRLELTEKGDKGGDALSRTAKVTNARENPEARKRR